MATAHECDICGNLYKYVDRIWYPEIKGKNNTLRMAYIHFRDGKADPDLCPNCLIKYTEEYLNYIKTAMKG